MDNQKQFDFHLVNEGSIIILQPDSESACDWCDENLSHAQRWGDGYVVEPRYIGTVVDGMKNDGLVSYTEALAETGNHRSLS